MTQNHQQLSKKLSARERADLKRCEHTIKTSLEAYMACGTALAEVKNKTLYRETYQTFEDYVRDKWGHTRGWAYRLIQIHETAQELPKVNVKEQPSARAYLPITQVTDPKVRDKAWEGATAEAERKNVAVSEAIVKKHVKRQVEATGRPKPRLVDENGVTVPRDLEAAWKSRAYSQGAHASDQVLRAANMLPIGIGRRAEAIRLAKELKSLWADVQPYVVCPACSGQKCGWCNNQGYMAQHKYADYLNKMEGKA